MGIAHDEKSKLLFICDTHNSRIQVFDYNGNFIRKWGNDGYHDGEFSSIISIVMWQ